MNVEAKIDPGLRHAATHVKHLGAFFEARAGPFAVEVGAGGVGAEMPAPAAVGVHVGHDVKARFGKQATGERVSLVQQTV